MVGFWFICFWFLVMVVVGVLALQGDFSEHCSVLRQLNCSIIEVRTPSDLEKVERIIIPGGESTVMSKLLTSTGLRSAILKRVGEGSLPIFGTCAGAILLAGTVTGKHPPDTLNILPITMERNAYGTQAQSFDTLLAIQGIAEKIPVSFIRAPRITKVSVDVEVLAAHDGNPVLVRMGRFLAATFHPEVRGEDTIHRLFLTV